MNRKEFEKKQADKPLKLGTRLLAERLGSVKHQIDALQLIEKTFEAELGATSTNMCIVEIMPEGEKPPLTEFFNTTDKSVLYPRLVQYCLENAQELPKDKRERACSHLEAFMEVFTKQTENAPEPTETPPEPQRLGNLLPDGLRTDEAVNVFNKAIGAGLMEVCGDEFKWKRSKALLAYFLGHFLVNGVFLDKEFSTLFNESRLSQAYYRLADNKHGGGKPRGYEEIDRLFEQP